MTLDDLPSGWSLDQSQSDTADTSSTEPNVCNLPSEAGNLPEASASFQQSDFGPYFTEVLAQFPSASAAQAWMQQGKAGLPCGDWIQTDQDTGQQVTWHTSVLQIPTYGDESLAVQLSADVPDLGTTAADAVFIRVGDKSIMLINLGFGSVDSNLTQQLAAKAVDKLKASS